MLKPISSISDVFRKDFEIDTTYLTTNPKYTGSTKMIVEAGKWVKISGEKLHHVRATGPAGATAGNSAATIGSGSGTSGVQWAQLWSDKGDYGMQALGKAAVMLLGQYEATTDMYESGVAEGDLLTVGETGNLVTADGAGDLIVAQCTKVDSTAGTINFIKFAAAYPLQ